MAFQKRSIIQWVLRILAAAIMLQTLFYKFSGAEESIYIFSKLGIEPWGRIGTGIGELIASVLILIPATTVFGAILGTGLMSGAIFFHLTKLGIVVKEDSGQLFIYALLVFMSCLIMAWMDRRQLVLLFQKQKPR
ncbi:MAG TPA: DoxX family protein [Puia sp.]|uniref:DoxX family protein n=1 Tax=Puia sp. TaxID=2045100 RepID=UPI002CB6701B|nr:DoxX family protein [Puia sp.]HVU96067.1 DoxX family protein [Puia sp.]